MVFTLLCFRWPYICSYHVNILTQTILIRVESVTKEIIHTKYAPGTILNTLYVVTNFHFKTKWSYKWSEVTQLCLTLCDPMDCSPPGSLVHGIFQAWILEWVAIPFSRGSSRPRDRTQVSRIVSRRLTVWATREAPDHISSTSIL